MSQIRVLICRIDEQNADQMTELARFEVPEVEVRTLNPETALDELEATTREIGYAILRRLLQARWEAIDEELAEEYRQRFSP